MTYCERKRKKYESEREKEKEREIERVIEKRTRIDGLSLEKAVLCSFWRENERPKC